MPLESIPVSLGGKFEESYEPFLFDTSADGPFAYDMTQVRKDTKAKSISRCSTFEEIDPKSRQGGFHDDYYTEVLADDESVTKLLKLKREPSTMENECDTTTEEKENVLDLSIGTSSLLGHAEPERIDQNNGDDPCSTRSSEEFQDAIDYSVAEKEKDTPTKTDTQVRRSKPREMRLNFGHAQINLSINPLRIGLIAIAFLIIIAYQSSVVRYLLMSFFVYIIVSLLL